MGSNTHSATAHSQPDHSFDFCLTFLLLSVLIAITLFPASASAAPFTLATSEYPPYSYTKNGKTTGCTVELIKEAFHRMGHSVSFKVMPWSRALHMVKQGKADGIFPGLRNKNREQYLIYATALYHEHAVFAVRKGYKSPYNGTLDSISHASLGVVRGYKYGKYFEAAREAGFFGMIEKANTDNELLAMLEAKRFDYLVGYREHILWALQKRGTPDAVRILKPELDSIPVFLGFSRKKKLFKVKKQFDQVMEQMIEDGTYQSIMNAYCPPIWGGGIVPPQ